MILVSARGQAANSTGFQRFRRPTVSFDGTQILFAGKAGAATSPWQIWETPAAGGTPRQIVHCQSDCTHPVYIPDGRIAYTLASAAGSDIEIVDGKGGTPQRLTFAPGRFVTQDVLRDGRILMESGGELYTVYPDGTGVESLRCDHGPHRSGARQMASGDVIFSVGGKLARFTPALASQTDVAQPAGEPAGPIAEIAPGSMAGLLCASPIVRSAFIPGRVKAAVSNRSRFRPARTPSSRCSCAPNKAQGVPFGTGRIAN